MKIERMGITEILSRVWLFSANKIKSSESFSKQPTQLIIAADNWLIRLTKIFDNNFSAIFGQLSNCHYTDKVKFRHFDKATKFGKKWWLDSSCNPSSFVDFSPRIFYRAVCRDLFGMRPKNRRPKFLPTKKICESPGLRKFK